MSWPARKWIYGPKIDDGYEAVSHIRAGGTLMVSGRPIPPKVAMNWSVAMIFGAVGCGRVCAARLNPLYVERPVASRFADASPDDRMFEEVEP